MSAPGTPAPAPAPSLDSDGDRVPDNLDLCPGTPPRTTVGANGCPAGTVPLLPAPPTPTEPAPAPLLPAPSAPVNSTISLNPSARHQTISGWEGAVLASIEDYKGFSDAQLSALLDLTAEVGFSRGRLSIRAGAEGGGGTSSTIVNDNADPNVINPAAFDFSVLDYQIDRFIVPMRQRLAARGEKFYTSLQYDR